MIENKNNDPLDGLDVIEGDDALVVAAQVEANARKSAAARAGVPALANPHDVLEGLEARVREHGPGEAFRDAVLDAANELQASDGPGFQQLRAALAAALREKGSSRTAWETALRERRKVQRNEARAAAAAEARASRARRLEDMERTLAERERAVIDDDDPFVREGFGYTLSPKGIEYETFDRRGDSRVVHLTNFVVIIDAQHVHHGPVGTTREYEIRVRVGEREPRAFRIDALDLASPSWIESRLGAIAWLSPEERDAWKLAFAGIKRLSAAPERHTYGLTGWRELGGQWAYVDAGGAIGAQGRIDDVRVVIANAPRLGLYRLPDPPEGDALVASVRAVFDLLRRPPTTLWAPLVGLALRSAMGPSRAQIHVYGTTGAGKSEVCAVVQRMFGPGFANGSLPASWQDSAASLVARRHLIGDAVLVVDDAAPSGRRDTERQQAALEAVFRSGFNMESVSRSDRSGRVRPEQSPRASVLSCGEFRVSQVPSVANRVLSLELTGRLPFDLRELIDAAPLHAGAMAAFVRWLAPQMGELRAGELAKRDEAAREHYRAHDARLAEIVGPLRVGLETFVAFARSVGVRDDITARAALAALDTVAAQQVTAREGDDAGTIALECLRAAVLAGRAHVTKPDGTRPDHCRDLGYRLDGRGELSPQGDRIGIVHERYPGAACLSAALALGTIRAELHRSGAPELFRDGDSLGRALHAAGLLVDHERGADGTGKFTKRIKHRGQVERWLVVRWPVDAGDSASNTSSETSDSDDERDHAEGWE